MNRVRIHQTLALAGFVVLAACGGHLDAVKVTGGVGDRLAAHEPALEALPATCLEVATLSGASDDCADLRARARSWGRVVALVEAYARGLRSADALPVDTAGDAWPGLSPAQAQAANTLSDAVRRMWLRVPSEGQLRSTIANSDAAVQEITRGIDEVVAHELERLELARTAIDVVRDRLQQLATMARPASRPGAPARSPGIPADARPSDKTSASVAAELAPVREGIASLQDRVDEALEGHAADRATERQVVVPGSLAELGLLQNDLESKRAGLERLRDAADAFGRAHKALHDNLERLGPDELMAEVVRAISQPAPSAIPGPR